MGDETIRARHWGPAHTGGDVSIHFEQANMVHLGDLLNNRGYPNVDAPAGASVHGWIQVLEKMAAAYPADALYVYGHAEAGHPFIGTRPDLLYQRDYFTAVIEMARAGPARRQGQGHWPRSRCCRSSSTSAAQDAPGTGVDNRLRRAGQERLERGVKLRRAPRPARRPDRQARRLRILADI